MIDLNAQAFASMAATCAARGFELLATPAGFVLRGAGLNRVLPSLHAVAVYVKQMEHGAR